MVHLKSLDNNSVNYLMDKIKEYTVKIEKCLKKEVNNYSWSCFYEPMIYILDDGKRIRPLILNLAYESIGKGYEDPLPASVAIELLHTESIIHDDIIDQEISRRNRLAFHVKYGYNTSILTADFVFGIILDIASRYNNSSIARELSSSSLRMCEGEFREMKIDNGNCKIGWEEYISIISQKTASLFQTTAKIGAIIGGGDKNEINAFSNYGLNIGIAYQLQDDILDWGEDGKILNALEDKSSEEDLLIRLNEASRNYSKRAKNDLDFIQDSESKKYLLELADFTVDRQN